MPMGHNQTDVEDSMKGQGLDILNVCQGKLANYATLNQ